MHVAGQGVHSGVDFLVDGYEGEVDVHAVVEVHPYGGGAVAAFAAYLFQPADLLQLAAHVGRGGVLQLACGGVGGGDAHRDVGMSTDGSNVTGIALYVTIPMMKKARKAITTAVGLLMRNFTIVSISSRRRRATRGRG